jgi:hypothetical protein
LHPGVHRSRGIHDETALSRVRVTYVAHSMSVPERGAYTIRAPSVKPGHRTSVGWGLRRVCRSCVGRRRMAVAKDSHHVDTSDDDRVVSSLSVRDPRRRVPRDGNPDAGRMPSDPSSRQTTGGSGYPRGLGLRGGDRRASHADCTPSVAARPNDLSRRRSGPVVGGLAARRPGPRMPGTRCRRRRCYRPPRSSGSGRGWRRWHARCRAPS